MAFTVEQFSKRVFKPLDAVVDGRGADRILWIPPAPSVCGRDIKDDRSLPVENVLTWLR